MNPQQLTLIVWWVVIFGVSGAIIGSIKKLGLTGFFLGIILGPIGILVISVMLANSKIFKKECPECAMWVGEKARVCPWCRHKFPMVAPETISTASAKGEAESASRINKPLIIFLLVLIIIIVIAIVALKITATLHPHF
jgi:ABC-type antimicrobial peptide transport system permease subunit